MDHEAAKALYEQTPGKFDPVRAKTKHEPVRGFEQGYDPVSRQADPHLKDGVHWFWWLFWLVFFFPALIGVAVIHVNRRDRIDLLARLESNAR